MQNKDQTNADLLKKITFLEEEIKRLKEVNHTLEKKKTLRLSSDDSESLFKDMFYKHSAIKLLIDPKNGGAIVDANDAAVEFYGYQKQELLSKSILDLNTLPADEVTAKMKKAEKQELNIFDFQHMLADRTVRYVRVHSHPLKKNNKELLHSIIYDITDQKETQQAINRSEEKFRTLINNSFDIISIISPEGICLYESPSTKQILGYEAGERVGENIFDFVHPGDFTYIKTEFRNLVLSPDAKKTVEFRFLHKNGSWRNMRVTGQNLMLNPIIKGILINARDITEQKVAEQNLKESEALFRTLVENQGEGVGILDEYNNFEFVNPAILRIFESNENELLYRNLKDFIKPDDICTFTKEEESGQNAELYTYEINILTPPGNEHTVLITTTPQYDSNGTFSGTFRIFTDISERKQMELRLIRKQKRIENILHGTNAGTWSWNINTNELFLDDRWAEILGYHLGELKPVSGYTFFNNVHPDDIATVNNALSLHIKGINKYYDIEFRMKHKKGFYVWINARGKIFDWDDEGKPLIMSGTHLDITKRKEAELKLLESEETFRNIVNNAIAGIVKCDKYNNFTFVNKAMADFVGYEQRELLSMNFKDITYPEDLNIGYKMLEQLTNYEIPNFRMQKRYLTKNSEIVWGEAFISILRDSNGEFLSYVGIIIDITTRKHAEEELKEMNVTKDKLLAIISHDLRNPFHNILASISMLTNFCENENCEEAKNLITIINKSARLAYNKLDDLLEWTKIQTGRIEINRENIFIPSLLEKVIDEHQHQAKSKNISILVQSETEVDIHTDRRMLHSILDNLLNNAIKFSIENSSIIIEVSQKNDLVYFAVEDHGVGMKKQTLEKLFNAGESISLEGTKGEKGSGLGLILCKEFIGLLKGEIFVESEPGEGTKISFMLPK